MPLLSNLKVRLDEVVQGLAAADQTGVAVVYQHDRRSRHQVVVAGHGQAVCAGAGHGDQVAGVELGHCHVFEEHIAAFTIAAGDGHRFCRSVVHAVADQHGVRGVIERRANVVGHAAIHGHVFAHTGNLLA